MLAILAVPPAIFRAMCLGNSCAGTGGGTTRVPFCPLPPELRSDIQAGFRTGRSPDVLGVTAGTPVIGGTAEGEQRWITARWPSTAELPDTRVPIAFAGAGVWRGARIPPGTGLDQIAPTVSDVLGFPRPHPGVRAGVAVPGVRRTGATPPRLVLEVAWKGVGSEDLERVPGRWPFLRSMMAQAGTMDGTTGSVPVDPAATLTTIGTGGLPSQHGMTGTAVRNDRGRAVRAWGPGSPISVIATLADDMDQAMHQRPMIGLVATDPADRGMVGGTWYVPHDRDRVSYTAGRTSQQRAVANLLADGFGADGVPDILAVVMQGPIFQMDAELREIVGATNAATGGSTIVVVAGTGSALAPDGSGVPAQRVVAQVERAVGGERPVVAAAVPGGLFLNQPALAAEGISGQAVQQAVLDLDGPGAQRLFTDSFQGFAVSFARYC